MVVYKNMLGVRNIHDRGLSGLLQKDLVAPTLNRKSALLSVVIVQGLGVIV